jgi:hypothetical protein
MPDDLYGHDVPLWLKARPICRTGQDLILPLGGGWAPACSPWTNCHVTNGTTALAAP